MLRDKDLAELVPHGNTLVQGNQFLQPRANSESECLLQHLGTSWNVPS